ncbi:olfactory receptor 52K1-like [Macrochelys suwanniensis]
MPQKDNLSGSNSTGSDPSVFFLAGIQGLEALHPWISIPFCSVFTLILLGNFILLYVIKTEPSLQKSMFYFLTMLVVIDLILSAITMPKTLSIFWFNSREISFNACLVQIFFLCSFFIMESAVLLAISFDRYVAICNPLRYATNLTNSTIGKIGLAALARAVLLTVPLPFLLRRLPYCGSHVIPHFFCEYMALVKVACADTRLHNDYAITVALFIMGLDLIFISLSYVKILRAVLSLESKEEQLKALGTCVSHLCAISIFYIAVVLFSLIHRFGHHFDPNVNILLAHFNIFFPPMMNPIMYGVKTKQIRDWALLLFRGKSFWADQEGAAEDLEGEDTVVVF